jgi:hypothetical protein
VHKWRWVSLVALAVVVASCSSGSGSQRSETPRISEPSRQAELSGALLTNADLQHIPGLPSDIAVKSVDDMKLFEDPDPRGPCGARVAQPDLSTGAVIGISAQAVQGFEAVVELPVTAAENYLRALREDARPGCAAYDSTTNTGSTQHVRLIRPVDIGAAGDERTAGLLEISNEGHTFEAFELAVRSGGRVALFVLFSFSGRPLDDDSLRAVAEPLARRLHG